MGKNIISVLCFASVFLYIAWGAPDARSANDETNEKLKISIAWDHDNDIKENQPSVSISGIKQGNVIVTSHKKFGGREFSGHSLYRSKTDDEPLIEVFARRVLKNGSDAERIDVRLETTEVIAIGLQDSGGHAIVSEVLTQSDGVPTGKSLRPGSYKLWITRKPEK